MNAGRGHWLDRLYLATSRGPRLFRGGWGDIALLESIEVLARGPLPTHAIDVAWREPRVHRGLRLRHGTFESPAASLLPEESKTAVVLEVAPDGDEARDMTCVAFAATSEEGFDKRLGLARLLARRGVTTVILENPFYGARRPRGQIGSKLRFASDQCSMVAAAILEGRALANHLRERGGEGSGALAVAGVSMGGLVAADVVALSPFPLAVVACLAPSSGVAVYLDGPLGQRVDWERLAQEAGGHEAARARFARLVLRPGDVTTHPPPRCPELAILVAGTHDLIVPPSACRAIHDHWSGSELRTWSGGHVSGWLFGQKAMAGAVLDALERFTRREGKGALRKSGSGLAVA